MTEYTKKIFASDVFIQEGMSPVSGVLIIACTVGDDYDNPEDRIVVKKGEEWLNFGFEGEAVVSVDAAKDGKAYVLGEEGSVIVFDWNKPKTNDEILESMKFYENVAVEDIGPLRCLRIVGKDVFCGGTGGQIYRFSKGKFYDLPRLLIDGKEQMIEDISGASINDLLVVTVEGIAARYDGNKWHRLDIPTNASLTRICAFGDGRYAIAGKEATILIGNRNKWEIVNTDKNSDITYWGIAYQNETLYAAHLGGIDVIKGNEISPLKIPNKKDLEFCVLRSGPDGIWSCSGHTIGLITDAGWQTIEI